MISSGSYYPTNVGIGDACEASDGLHFPHHLGYSISMWDTGYVPYRALVCIVFTLPELLVLFFNPVYRLCSYRYQY